MGLFSTLASASMNASPQKSGATDGSGGARDGFEETVGTDASKKQTGGGGVGSSSSLLPTVVQLYTRGDGLVRLEYTQSSSGDSVGVAPLSSSVPLFHALTYSAVHAAAVGQPHEGLLAHNAPTRQKKDAALQYKPDLGVWNACVYAGGGGSSSNAAVDAILKTIPAVVVPSGGSSSSSLHHSMNAARNKFCLTVDLANLSEVEPAVTSMQEAVVRLLIARGKPAKDDDDKDRDQDGIDPTATTSLYRLRSVPFGLAPDDDQSAAKLTSTAPAPEDRDMSVSLMVCAVWPPGRDGGDDDEDDDAAAAETEEDYRDRQARSLVLYHLRRYTAALNATLCFVDKRFPKPIPHTAADPVLASLSGSFDRDAVDLQRDPHRQRRLTGDATQPPLLTLRQLALVWREWASGKEVWTDEQLTEFGLQPKPQQQQEPSQPAGEGGDGGPQATTAQDGSEETAAVAASPHSAIYGPGAHQEDLIESVLLRNANYPGHWDASKDSMWKVLPAPSQQKQQTEKAAAPATGDDHWLSELRDSVAAAAEPAVKTPTAATKGKKASSKAAGSDTKDGDVTNYFESLLKKS